MADIIIEEKITIADGESVTYQDAKLGKFETSSEAKSALREKGDPGEYRISQVKWEGPLYPKGTTLLSKK